MEPRKNFYADELDMARMNKVLDYVIENLTLKEILKMIREISHDMVCYYSEYNKGIVYNNKLYSKENQYQANQLQRLLRDACDLFGQSIINKRVFEEGCLNKYLNGIVMEREITMLEQKIKDLENELMERNEE